MTKRMTEAEFLEIGKRLFGNDSMKFRFVCPCCGYVQTPEDYKAAGAPANVVGFSCVGRWRGMKREAIGGKGPGPCNYAGGGLFKLNPIILTDRNDTGYFAFDGMTGQRPGDDKGTAECK